jgi:3-dehydroquinate dehydratase-2
MKYGILVLNGPGLSDLRDYDPGTFGELTLRGIRDACSERCESLGLALDFRQTEDEDELLRWIGKDSKDFDGVVLNPVAYSKSGTLAHTGYRQSTAAIAGVKKPAVVVHIGNIFAESFEHSGSADEPAGAAGFVCGLGLHGYVLAIRAIAHRLGIQAAPGA